MGRFGAKLGQAFQIADDVLDMTATAEELGKSPGKDAAANKQTYPRCVGVEASRVAAERAVREALAELGVFGAEADDLRALAAYVVDRNY
jgi:geranylgeranyl pyrophosphate synthase